MKLLRAYVGDFQDDGWSYDNPSPNIPNTIFEEERIPEYSGLLDANGEPLYRPIDRIKFGFVP